MMGFHKNIKRRIYEGQKQLDEKIYKALQEIEEQTNKIIAKLEVYNVQDNKFKDMGR
jgi:hypothetical protein